MVDGFILTRYFARRSKKRTSCSADGPKALPFDLSPRGGFAFVSDADSRIWLNELEALEV